MSESSGNTETKRQHFVPQFLLREFAVDAEGIFVGMYLPSKDLLVERAPIKRQAYEDYFYGKDGKLETLLGKIESSTAPVVRKIVQEGSLPPEGSQAYADLLLFSVLLHTRTRKHADNTNEWVDKTIKLAYENHPEIGQYLDRVNIELTNPAGFAVGYSMEAALLATDLKCKLLINRTAGAFVCSENQASFTTSSWKPESCRPEARERPARVSRSSFPSPPSIVCYISIAMYTV